MYLALVIDEQVIDWSLHSVFASRSCTYFIMIFTEYGIYHGRRVTERCSNQNDVHYVWGEKGMGCTGVEVTEDHV